MYDSAIKILRLITEAGFEAYIVGGYPRDKYLGIISTDIDICTSATPSDIEELFSNVDTTYSKYGSVRLEYSGYLYEVTTFRKDKALMDGNRYYEVEYACSLEEDLKRRDFIINTLCIDYNGNYVDYLEARNDMDKKVIRTVKVASISFREDPLRILRAIRFCAILSFDLSDDLCDAINELKYNLTKLSKTRVQKELTLILESNTGVNILKKFEIDKLLNIDLG